MWEFLSFAGGIVFLMLLSALIPHVFDLPEALAKYFRRRLQRSDVGLPPRDPDETAARILGESLRRASVSSEATEKVMAAFWAADTENRRALAHLVAGVSEDGPVEDEDLLVLLPGFRAARDCPSNQDKKPRRSTDIREFPAGQK